MNKPQHRKGSASYFFSPSIIGLKSETPHMVQFESPQDHKMGILFTAIPHKNISNTEGVKKPTNGWTDFCNIFAWIPIQSKNLLDLQIGQLHAVDCELPYLFDYKPISAISRDPKL